MNNTNKWFLEIVQDVDGSYYANMFIDEEKVQGLEKNVDYNSLRRTIKQTTGIEILKKKDMFFMRDGNKKYAYLDNTRERDDCRVTLTEIRNGWRPEFKKLPFGDTIYLYPRASHTLNLKTASILEGVALSRTPSLPTEGHPSAATVTIHIQNEIFKDGSTKKMDQTYTYYDSDSLYEHSLEKAQEKANEVFKEIEEIKNLPRTLEPMGPYGIDYFDVIDLKALSNQELISAKELAKKYVGPQSIIVSAINTEMQNRFEEYVKKPSIDSLITDAKDNLSTTPKKEHKSHNKEMDL